MLKFDDIIANSKNFLVLSSMPIDHDSIGSGLMMKLYLESLGKTVINVLPGYLTTKIKERFAFMPFFDSLMFSDTNKILSENSFNAVIFLDGANMQQFFYWNSESIPDFSNIKTRIHIDHHMNHDEKLGEYNFFDEKASSTCEIIVRDIIPKEKITADIATLGYAGILGDTGNFKWHFDSNTLSVASILVESGADKEKVIDKICYFKNKKYFEIESWVLKYIEYNDKLETVFLFIPYELCLKEGIDKSKYKDIREVFLDIANSLEFYGRGVIIGEIEKNSINVGAVGNNYRNKINLPELFRGLGGNGGGHFHASGGNFKIESFSEFKEKLLSSLAAS